MWFSHINTILVAALLLLCCLLTVLDAADSGGDHNLGHLRRLLSSNNPKSPAPMTNNNQVQSKPEESQSQRTRKGKEKRNKNNKKKQQPISAPSAVPTSAPTATTTVNLTASDKMTAFNTSIPTISPTKSPYMQCGIHLLNGHNVGHIFADVFPSIFNNLKDPNQESCTFVLPTHAALKAFWHSPIVRIADQMQFKLHAQTKEQFEANGIEGVDFHYHPMMGKFPKGFQRVQQLVQQHITNDCQCSEYPTVCNETKVLVFNRDTRHYSNHIELLSKLEELAQSGIGLEWEYVNSTYHFEQCWHFCHYRNASIVFTPYGAESIYPVITNRSSIVMGYHGRKDYFLERVVGAYGFHGGDLVVLNVSRALEGNNKECYERWMHPSNKDEGYFYHKCMSYYMDPVFIDQAIETIHEFRRRDCERIAGNLNISDLTSVPSEIPSLQPFVSSHEKEDGVDREGFGA